MGLASLKQLATSIHLATAHVTAHLIYNPFAGGGQGNTGSKTIVESSIIASESKLNQHCAKNKLMVLRLVILRR